jgi:hypothetical protein
MGGTFLAAGLPIPQMILAGRVEGGPDSLVYDYYADIARSLLPMSKHIDAATTATLEIDGLAERLRTESVAHHASIMPPTPDRRLGANPHSVVSQHIEVAS